MGQFASTTNLTMPEIVTLAVQSVTEPVLALSDLNLIIQALSPRTAPTPPPVYTDLALAIEAAINAADADAPYFFDNQFSDIILPATSLDGGVVLNYNENGNLQLLISQITSDLTNWDIQISADDITLMATNIQEQVDNCDLTPSTTYGQAPLTGVTTVAEIAGWVTAYGVFRTGANASGGYNYAVIYSFCAAAGVPEIVTL